MPKDGTEPATDANEEKGGEANKEAHNAETEEKDVSKEGNVTEKEAQAENLEHDEPKVESPTKDETKPDKSTEEKPAEKAKVESPAEENKTATEEEKKKSEAVEKDQGNAGITLEEPKSAIEQTKDKSEDIKTNEEKPENADETVKTKTEDKSDTEKPENEDKFKTEENAEGEVGIGTNEAKPKEEEGESKNEEQTKMESSPATETEKPVAEEEQENVDKEEGGVKTGEEQHTPEYKANEECDAVLQETPEKEDTRYALLEKLLSLLSSSEPLNPILAGYFSKVLGAILEKYKPRFLGYILRYPEHLNNIIKHSESKSIADLLGRLLVNDDQYDSSSTTDEYASQKREIINHLISKMEAKNSIDEITNSCYILCTLIDSKQFFDYFVSEPVLKRLYEIGISANPMSLRGVLTLMVILNRLKFSLEIPSFVGFESSEYEKKEDAPDFINVIKFSVDYLEYAKEYLEKPNESKVLEMPFGGAVTPFGLDRLKIVEWICSLLSLKENTIANKLLELDMGSVLLSLIRKYDSNTMLHLKTFKIFEDALKINTDVYIKAVFF